MKNLIRIYFGVYRKEVAAIITALILQAVLQIFIIISISPIIVSGIQSTDMDVIVRNGLIMMGLIVLYSMIAFSVSYLSAKTSAKAVCKIREDMFTKILSLKRSKDSGASLSGLMTRLVSDVNAIQAFMTELMSMGLYIPILAAGIVVSAAIIDTELSIILFTSLMITMSLTFVIGKGELKGRSRLQWMMDRTIHLFKELILGARTARGFGRVGSQYESFDRSNSEFGNFATAVNTKSTLYSSMSTLLLSLIIILFYALVFWNLRDYDVSIGEMVVILQYIILFINCASITPFIITTVPIVRAAIGRISKVMNSESERFGNMPPLVYDGPIIRCSNGFIIDQGKEVSLIGGTGSGKSEIVSVMLGLDDVGPNEMWYKGVDVTELDHRGLRERIVYAGSLALTFSGTVRQNINAWRDIPEERFEAAIAAAKVNIGLDEVIEKHGSNISAGQKQRISIARALASDADLYVFDDCFTELDPETENEIVFNIRRMLVGKTVLFSSHQFRIAPGSDTVAVVDDGKILDMGTHRELLSRCQLYRSMYAAGGGMIE